MAMHVLIRDYNGTKHNNRIQHYGIKTQTHASFINRSKLQYQNETKLIIKIHNNNNNNTSFKSEIRLLSFQANEYNTY